MGVSMIESALPREDTEGNAALKESLENSNVRLIGSADDDDEDGENVMMSLDAMLTVTEVMEHTQSKAESVFMSLGAWSSAHCVDLAVARGAKVMRLALPTASKNGVTEQYNRWLILADELTVDEEEEENADGDAQEKAATNEDSKEKSNAVSDEQVERDEVEVDQEVANGDHETNETEALP